MIDSESRPRFIKFRWLQFVICACSSNPAVDQLIQSIFVETFDQQNIGRLTSEAIRTQLTQLAADESFVNKVASLKSTVQRKKECLSHGLLSTAAVGVKDGNVKVKKVEVLFRAPCEQQTYLVFLPAAFRVER